MKRQLIKICIALILVSAFFALGGFSPPQTPLNDFRKDSRMVRAWAATVMLFAAGLVLTLWGNQIAENIDWDIPDGAYPIIGVMLLAAGFVWMLMVNGSV